MTRKCMERLVLSLPAEPDLARLTRRVTYHFCRENGIRTIDARKGARQVERGCHAMLKRASGRTGEGGSALVLVLTSGMRALEAIVRQRTRGAARRLFRLERTGTC